MRFKVEHDAMKQVKGGREENEQESTGIYTRTVRSSRVS